MKKIVPILFAACAAWAAPKNPKEVTDSLVIAHAESMLSDVNYVLAKGWFRRDAQFCLERYGIYFLFHGEKYVIETSSEQFRDERYRLNLERVYKTDKLCYCGHGGGFNCE